MKAIIVLQNNIIWHMQRERIKVREIESFDGTLVLNSMKLDGLSRYNTDWVSFNGLVAMVGATDERRIWILKKTKGNEERTRNHKDE